jgi:hypothetical protein
LRASEATNVIQPKDKVGSLSFRMDAAMQDQPLVLRIGLSYRWLLLPLLACLSLICGAVLYLGCSYDRLAAWYLGLNSCFYKSYEWQQMFFTPATHAKGRKLCIAGIVLALALVAWLLRAFLRRKSWRLDLSYSKADRIAVIGLWTFGFVIWLYGMLRAVPGYDEVFSAVNCAGIHPFQAATYYMLPNNHVFFNLLNSLLGRLFSDNLLSARIISGCAAFALIPVLYKWMRHLRIPAGVAAAFVALMLLQFPVWGFAFQGRGYLLYLLCAWTAFISLQHYFDSGNRMMLAPHILATVIGFWIMPTYLFWEAAILMYALYGVIRTRQIRAELIAAFGVAAGFVILAYLPLLCFSGLGAITENRYVVAEKAPFASYAPDFWNGFRSGIQYTFSGSVDAKNGSYLVAFFLPMALLPFLFRRRVFSTLLFLLFVWVSFTGLLFYMQRFPFMRNLIAHSSLTLAALLICGYTIIHAVLKTRLSWLQAALPILGCLAVGLHFAQFNRQHIYDSLYFYQSESRYNTLHDTILKLPADAKVWVSAEGFYWEYLCKRHGLPASMCLGPAATHYIRMETEPLPPELEGRVEKIYQADEYEILRIKQ